MKTVTPENGLIITDSVRLKPGTYYLPDGIVIRAKGIAVESTGVMLIGINKSGVGVYLDNCENVELFGINLRSYFHGIEAHNSRHISIAKCDISDTHELAANTLFLDIWRQSQEAYGGAIFLSNCDSVEIGNNNLQHQQNGLLAYNCLNVYVHQNQCNYNSGAGIYLNNTSDSIFTNNSCDYCCRFEPRDGNLHHGHMGADAAGFVVVMNSCRNKFIRNTARMSGDGFFLAGYGTQKIKAGCDDNLFEENDASWSPNIAFEATFCSGNKFVNNKAHYSNYGFWCGFSTKTEISDNLIYSNKQAGIAVENGTHFTVRHNNFRNNTHGILLWNHPLEMLQADWQDRDTSKDWSIENNKFENDGIGIRIAANQSHGTQLIELTEFALKQPQPNNHRINNNRFSGCRIGVQLLQTNNNSIENNYFENSIVQDIEGTTE